MPARRSVASEWILPYDDVRRIVLSARSFSANDCICRVQRDLLGHRCGFPLAMCLSFSNAERSALPGDISREEALALLDRSEEIGLVHTVSNVAHGVGYICNCCGCCCGILRGITDWGIENSVAHANYYAVIDPALCAGCGTCIERCQVHAIHDEDGVSVVAREKCIGCGLCVTGCPDSVPQLLLRPEAEMRPSSRGFRRLGTREAAPARPPPSLILCRGGVGRSSPGGRVFRSLRHGGGWERAVPRLPPRGECRGERSEPSRGALAQVTPVRGWRTPSSDGAAGWVPSLAEQVPAGVPIRRVRALDETGP